MTGLLTIHYTAPTTIRDSTELAQYIHSHLDRHLVALGGIIPLTYQLEILIETFDFSGQVRAQVRGTFNDSVVDFKVISNNQPPNLASFRQYRTIKKRVEWRRRNGLSLYLAWWLKESIFGIGRCIFPSRPARAIGSPLRSGLVLHSLHDALRDIRTQLTQIAGLDSPDLLRGHRRIAWISATILLIGTAGAAGYYGLADPLAPKYTLRVGSFVCLGFSFSGLAYGLYLITRPRFRIESTTAGGQLLRSLGMKSILQLRALALGLVLCGTGGLVLGLWLLLG